MQIEIFWQKWFERAETVLNLNIAPKHTNTHSCAQQKELSIANSNIRLQIQRDLKIWNCLDLTGAGGRGAHGGV